MNASLLCSTGKLRVRVARPEKTGPLWSTRVHATPSLGRRLANRAGLAIFAVAVAFGAPLAHGSVLVQEFYLPMPETQIYQANSAIVSGQSSTNFSTFSIVVTGNGTVINYDQWEDGYEVNLSSPAQPTTQIWGDGNDANGIPPGFAHDPAGLAAGTVITLTNNVPLPRNPSTILWDGRDRIASTKALVISRAAWPVNPGPVFAGAVGVLSVQDYGTNYISPVGTDLTNNLFKYVGMFVMAAQNNTTVTLDPNGTGVGATTVVLNQGESYLINNGVKKGGRVTATKPVQADVIIGHVGAQYASDWFTLYPVESWSSGYYTPVASAKSGNPAYVYLYNPNTNAITINYTTRSGSGSFSIPASPGVYRFQMPVASGASFVNTSGKNFFAVCTVGANNSSDTAYNWGFTLVPQDALTTEAVVGWGPGSANLTVNGSPVWVTPLANTRLYVDYKGDHAGPLTDPNGNHYDTNYDLVTLQSKTIYDPSKNQTGMRVYTLDGTLITAAWGEDPDVAQPGNPYIDAGTTVLPFPTPVLKKTAAFVIDPGTNGLSVGDIIEYTVEVDNKGLLPLGNLVLLDAPSTNLQYVLNSTKLDGNPVPDDVTGTPFPLDASGYTIPLILRGRSSTFKYRYSVIASGTASNNVTIPATAISAETKIVPPPTNGASCGLNFATSAGTPVTAYTAGASVYVSMANAAGNTSSNSAQSILVTVNNLTHGDVETIQLTETGVNTGVFFSGALLSSTSAGLGQQDGMLSVQAGDVLSVGYTDATFGNSCSAVASVVAAPQFKVLYLSTNGFGSPDQHLDRVDPVATGDNTTAQSIQLGGFVAATIGVDAVSSGQTNGSSLTLSHPTGSGTNRLMLVGISIDRSAASVSAVAYGGVALTAVGNADNGTGSIKPRIEIWSLLNPPTGTTNLVVNFSGAASGGAIVGVTTFTNVDQTTPLGTFAGATGNSTTPSVFVASATGEVVFDTVGCQNTVTLTAGAGQTERWNRQPSIRGAGSTEAGAASLNTDWSSGATAVRWALGAVSVHPAATVASASTTTFSQTPSFCNSFTVTSNGVVAITNYVTITAGSMPANPNITATLSYGSTTIISMANPVYNSGAGTLVWGGTMPTNAAVPAGQAITLTVSNAQGSVGFTIAFDSATKPSKISLPTTSIIHIESTGVYDAPYPGGSLVTAPVAGSTLYVRTVVSDPFGSYDITSLGLVITAPDPSANVNTNLTATSVVTNDSCTKIYEYKWQTGPITGGYNLALTANEGTEGISDVAGAGVTLTFLDLGTPSTTEFTSGNNGPATNGFSANNSVCARVTDLNRNLNSAAVESIIATVTSSAGDTEDVTLTETGTNTGVFTACVSASTSSGSGTNNGLLLAPVGSVITVSYTDPTDTSDQSSATAVILPAPGVPGVTMTKTLVSPVGGQTGIGQPVTFNLQVVNTGSTTLTNVTVTDNYPASKLTNAVASLPPTTVAPGILTWTNLGAMTPGQSTNLTVTFTTFSTGTASNSATANGGTATNSSSAIVNVTHGALNVTKMLLSPTNTPVPVGSNITFRITVQNLGDTVIPTLPLEDTFSGACYQFLSATIPPDGSGAGSLLWNNLASPIPLATNGIITLDITMKVVGEGNPANNTATADFAVDALGNPVPPVFSTIGVVTAAGVISGYVYDDKDQSGTLTAGDVPLSGVGLQLFTDPNGDGDPADGALVQVTTTDLSGYYELLNLNTGKFVVVESDLAGYASSAPVNNRLPVNLASLTVSTNHNFFDYQPSPVLYSTLSGTVWSDANSNGTNDLSETGLASVTIELVQDLNTNGVADLGEPVAATLSTDASGNYSFAGVTPGRYVIRETDLFGYYSTGDSQPPNDNQIAVNAVGGATYATNNFFDHLNQAPVANDDAASTAKNVAVTIAALANDSDPDGNALSITGVSPTNGTATFTATNITFTPALDFLGTATVGYTISDGQGGTASALITINVTNRPPVANDDSVTTPEDTALTFDPRTNDTDPDGDPLTITGASATNGTVIVLGGTNLVFTPLLNFNGTATVQYSISDGQGGTATASVTITVTPVNDAPIANSQSVTTPEDTAKSIVLTGSDADSTNLTFAILAGPTNGAITGLNPSTGTLLYSPATNYNGPDSFTFTISDGSIQATGTVSITVTPVNDAPLADDQSVTTPEDTAKSILLTGSDVDSTNLTFAVLTGPTNGAVSGLNTNTGALNYQPATNYNGLDNFTFTVFDGSLYATGTVSITVTPVNDAPVALDDLTSTPRNTPVFISVLANDSDVDGDVLTITSATPTNGAVSIVGTNLLFTPASNYVGVATIGYAISDGHGGTSSALVTVFVTLGTNAPPVAVDDTATIAEDTILTMDPRTNDFDPDGDPITITAASATNGTVSILGGTNLVFTPATNFNGIAIIHYTITDSLGATASANVTVTVTPINDAPLANNQSVTTPEDAAKSIVLTGSDVDSTNLTFAILAGPTNGVISGFNASTGALLYTPTANYNGPDSFTFTLSDGSLQATGTVSITVTPLNDAPIADDQSVSTPEDTAKSVVLTGSDVDSTNLTFAVLAGPTHGVVSGLNTNTGALSYQPATNYNGLDNFTFTVFDGSLYATGTVSITVTPVNDAPVADSQSVTTPEATAKSIVLTGSDLDSTNLTFAILAGPTNGVISGFNAGTGALLYTPAANYNGPDSFSFTLSDGSLLATGTVSITVTPLNDAPIADDQSVSTPEDTAKSIVLAGSDVDSTNLTFAVLAGPTHGAVSGLNTNTGALLYTPATNYDGLDSFTFTVFDGSLYATGLVSITVTPVNDAPVADSQSVTTPEDTAKSIVLTGSDVDSTNLTFAILVGPTNGAISGLNTNTGALTYRPATNYNGLDSFTFTVFDGSLYATGTVSITVNPVNDAPVADSQSVTTPEDTAKSIVLTGSDVDSTNLTFAILAGPANGAISGFNASTGALLYTPAANYNGPDSFSFTLSDGSLQATGTVSITVTPVNDAPLADDQSVTTPEDTAKSIVLTGSDVDSTNLTFAILAGPANGVISGFNPSSGALLYTPATNYNGPDSFSFTLSDGSLQATGTVSITVNPVNDAPVADSQSVTTPEDTAKSIVLTGSDVDSTNLTFAVLAGPTHGVISGFNPSSGALLYTPATNYNGPDSFPFTLSDGSLQATGTVSITVTPVNDGPVADSQSATTPEDTAKSIVLTGSDVDSTNLTFAILAGPANGVISGFNPSSGALLYTPATNYNGPDSFTFTLNDGSLQATGTVSITVNPVNDAPVADSQSVTTPEDTAKSIVLTGSDVDSTNLTFAVLAGPTNGVISGFNASTGALLYTPAANYNGLDSFTFTLSDGSLQATGTVSITVTPVNDAPIANSQSVTTPEDTAKSIVLTGSDADSTNLTFAILAGPANGAITGLNPSTGTLLYTPATNYNGPDSFTFTISDGSIQATGTVSITVTPVNDAPLADDQSVTTPEDTAKSIMLTGSDVDSTNLTFAVLTGPTNGAVSGLNTNTGALNYQPATNYNGLDNFTFTVFDGSLYATGTVSITVTPVNDAPVAVDDVTSTPRNTPALISVLANDSDVDGDVLTITGATPTNGAVSIVGTNLLFTPASNYVGVATIGYAISDGHGGTASALVTVFVTLGTNTPPVAVDDTATIVEDTVLTMDPRTNDFDPDGDPLTIMGASATNGTVSILGGTNLVFTPATNFNGIAIIHYTINDGFGATASANVTVTVTPINDAPVANNQSVTTPEDTAKSIVLTGSDVDSTNLTFAILAGPTNGLISGFNPSTGALLYTPTANYSGPDSFSFTLSDGSLQATGTVSITVTPVNDTPLADNQSVTTPEDTAKSIVLTGTDVDSTNLTFAVLAGPTHGVVSGLNTNTGALNYQPATNYNGLDNFTFTIFDGSLYATGTVTITVTPVNDAPVANNQSVTTPEDTAKSIVLTGSDVDSTNLTFAILAGPSNGVVSGFDPVTGALLYTPATNYNGPDSFTFTLSDGSLQATGTVSITVTPVNDAPLADDQSVTTPEDTAKSIVLTGSDVDSTNLTFAILAGPANGVISGFNASTGALLYTPAANYNGPDSFSFTLSDGSLQATGTVSITVTPVNDAPLADDQSVTTPEDTAKSIVLTGSDVDSTNLTFAILAGPTNGVISGFNASTGALLYTPTANYSGPDSFSFTLSDGSLQATGTVSITVTPVNDAPLADNQSVTTPEDTAKSIVLTGSDVDSTNLTFAILAGPTSGVISGLNTNTGALNYQPATNYNGLDNFTFTVFDGSLYATGTVSITVTPVNDAPVADSQSVTTPEATAKSIVLTGSDVDSTNLTFAILAGPSNGVVSGFDPVTGALLYTPAANYNGSDSFTFTLSDGSLQATGTVSIAVTPVNDAPIANSQSVTTPEDTAKSIVLTGSDVDSTNLTFAILAGPSNGAVSGFDPVTGALLYTPAANYNGLDTFTFTVFDGSLYATGLVSITVTPLNDAPIADDQSVSTPEDTAKSIVLTGSDVDSTNLTFAVLAGPTHGAVSGLNTNTGALLYMPATNYNGLDGFTFIVFDGSLYATGLVSITVTPVNDAPLADDQSVTTPEDTARSIVLTGSDVDSTNLTFAILAGPANGVISGFNASTGALLYTPATNYNGPDSLTFSLSDGFLQATGTVSITVTPVNDGPVALDDTTSTPKNTPVLISVLANDSDVDGDVLTITSATPTNGAVSIVGTNLLFTPASNYVGVATIGYAISDGNGGTASALVTVNVTLGTNTPPVAQNDTATTPEDIAVTIAPLFNDSDVDGDPLTITGASATNGTVSNVGGTNLVFTPAANFNGTATIHYTISDGQGGTASANVTVTVTPVNDAPVADNQSVTTPEDTAKSIVLTGSDVDSTNLTFAILAGPTNGAISGFNASTGALLYTPTTNYNGPDSFTFTLSDGSLQATGTVSISVTPVNDAPLADDQSVTTPEDTAKSMVLTGSDVDSTNLIFAILAGPTNGALSGLNTNTGALTYRPATNYNGLDGFIFTVFDGSLYATGTVSITVTPVNDAPIAVDDLTSTPKNIPVLISVLANDSDVDGDVLTITSATPTNGAVSIVGTNLLFTPASNFVGVATIGYAISDGNGGTASALVTVIVTLGTNTPPVAVDDTATIPEDTVLTMDPRTNDHDLDGDPLTITTASTTNGTVSVLGGTNLVVTPPANFNGTVTIHYTISDGLGGSASANVIVTVTPVNDAPIADNQSVATPRNTARNIVLTGSDVDSTNLSFAILNGPTNGVISGLDTNSGALIYTPAIGYLGLDGFTFTVFDGSLYATGNVSITVTLSNRAPVAINDAAYTHKNTAVTLYPLANDSDPDGDSLTISSLSPTNGTASIIGGTNVIFLPKTNFFGNAKIGYTISDGLGGTASALITVHVTNRPPVAVNDFAATTKNTAVSIKPLANDSDLDGDSLTIISVSPTNGTASIIGGTNVLFRPKTNFTGSGKVRYTISDGFGKTASALITVNVTNRLPVAVNDFAFTTENTAVTIKPLVNDSDPDGDRLTIISLRATNGTASIVGGTNVLFRPATNFTGVASIGYTIGDGYAGRASALITVSVTAAADVAVFKTGPANSRAGSNITFTITITNRGPSTAANVVVYDQLPAGFQFISGLPTEAGVSNNLVSWPAISLANHKTTNFQVTARSSAAGLFTNIAFSISDTPDPNPANNNGTSVGSQAKVSVTTNAAAPQFAIRAGTNVFNPQTGLLEQHVTVTNTGTGTAAAVRLLVGGLRSGVTLYNASGTNGTRPYAQYNAPLNPGQTVAFLLEFYVPDRRPFTDTLEAQAVFPATGRTNLTGGVAIDRSFFDYRIAGEPRFVIEFASIPGRTYTVVFSSDLKNWTAATPSITANANRTQWYDDGPPKTTSKPLSAASRYYQVILAPANP